MAADPDDADTPDDLDVFLETWTPSELLRHSSLPQYLDDPLSRKKLFDDSSASADVERRPYAEGPKAMDAEEVAARGYQFFCDHQAEWSAEFRDRVLSEGVPREKFDTYTTSFAKLWIDGDRDRHNSPEMLAIKASIRDFDRLKSKHYAGRFVITQVDDSVAALFAPEEVRAIFEVNERLLAERLADYLDHLEDGPEAVSDLYVRRGVFMPPADDDIRKELHYLSSYSLAIGPVEQFAQTWRPKTKKTGVATIFSAPLPAIQQRTVAFAPFIHGMDLRHRRS